MLSVLLISLPLLSFFGFLLLMGNLRTAPGWGLTSVRAAVLWGGTAVAIAEILSLFAGFTRIGVSAAWLVALIAVWIWLRFYVQPRRGLRWPPIRLPRDWFYRGLGLGLGLVLALTALVAWLAPPQTWDSLNYHMPRAAHWAQENAVRHFATGAERQNSYPPGAEILILHTYVLWAGDGLVNLVQWLAMAGSVAAASVLAGQLGASRGGRWLAAVFVATIPMGIVQATSTMNDFVVAFWTLCAALETVRWLQGKERRSQAVAFGSLAAGLAIYTKPTSIAFLAPFALLALYGFRKKDSPRMNLKLAGAAVLIVFGVNAGYLGRNLVLYGNPGGPAATVAQHANQVYGWRPLASNLIRNAALHMGTPKQAVNDQIYLAASRLHNWIDFDDNDPRTTLIGPYGPIGGFATHEDVVGNLLHSGIILVSFMYLLVARRRLGRFLFLYGLAAALTFVLFSGAFKWQIFGTRLHLPFFVLFAPAVGAVAGGSLHKASVRLMSMLLIIAAIPWLISINSRPLVPLKNRSLVDSILIEPRQRLYFANALSLLPVHKTITRQINQAGCSRVGIALRGGGAEYPLWVLLGAPRDSLEIEWITAGPSADRYEKEQFQPCAVICQRCPGSWQTARGLPEVYRFGEFRLFLGD